MHALIPMRRAAARVQATHGHWGRAALLLFALASLWLTAPANLGLGVALLAAVPALAAAWRNGARPDAVGLATLALAAWLTLRFGLQCAGFGEPGLIRPKAGYVDWMAPLAFAALAALVPAGQRLRWLRRLWGLAIAGCMLGVLGFVIARGPAVLWSGERLGFHLNRPLGIGLYAGVFIVVSMFTAPLWWRFASRWRPGVRSVATASIMLWAIVLLTSQNRSTLLALVIVLAAAALTALAGVVRNRQARGPRLLALLALLLPLALAVIAGWQAFEKRYVGERDSLVALESGGLAAAPATSVTVRLQLWRHALTRAADVPWIGNGFGGLQDVLDASLRQHIRLGDDERYDHLHNSYLQTLWTQGAIGVALWALLVALLLRDVMRATRAHPGVRALLPAVWGTLGFVAVWACFDYRLSHPDMRCFSILLLLSLRLLGQAGGEGSAPPSRSS